MISLYGILYFPLPPEEDPFLSSFLFFEDLTPPDFDPNTELEGPPEALVASELLVSLAREAEEETDFVMVLVDEAPDLQILELIRD